MNKILILYASYGGGHLSAAKNLKEYYNNHYLNTEVILFDFMKYINKVIDKVGVTAYSQINKNIPWLWGKIYYHTQDPIFERVFSLSNRIISYKLGKIFGQEKPNIIITTHFFASHICAILKKRGKINSKIATVITDYGEDPYNEWISCHEYIDYIFVAHSNIKKRLLNKGISENKVFDTGIPISEKFLINYNKSEIFKELNLSDNKKIILFFGGGEMGLGKSNTLKIFETLINNFDNYQIIAISGKNENLENHLKEIAEKSNRFNSVKIFGFTDKVAQLMQISDLVITKPGGLTTTECLVSHLPMITINPIPGQETENAEFLEKNGCSIWLKKEDNIYSVLSMILNNEEKLEEMKKNTFNIAKPDSTKNICNIIFEN